MKIVCFGNSLTSCGGENGRFSDILQDRFPGHRFVNRGVGGESFVEGLERFQADVLDEQPDIVLVEFGANDWWRDERPPEAWARDLEEVVTRSIAVGARVVVLGVFGDYLDDAGERVPKEYGTDERALVFRDIEAGIAEKHGCAYVPNIQERIIGRRCCWRDRNHPNEYGNRHVADSVELALEPMLDDSALPVRKPTLHTLRDIWREAVRLAPGQTAVADGDRRLTYFQADAIVRRIASSMAAAAGTARPSVAVHLPNCMEYYLIYWATVQLGGIAVPLNTWLKRDSLAAIMDSMDPDVLMLRTYRDADALDACKTKQPRMLVTLEAADDCRPGMLTWKELTESAGDLPEPAIDPDDDAIVMHTSGTTARPKGAVMRHSDLLFNIMTTINAHRFCASDVHLVVNPMFHCTALYSSLPTAAYTKTPVIIASPTRPDRLMRLVQDEKITTFLSTPSVFQQILRLKGLDSYDSSSLRVMGYAGSPMPVSAIRGLQKHFPEVDLHNFFGLTETTSMTHVLTGEEAHDRPDSIGRLLPFVEARIEDKDGGELPPGEVGELLFGRDNVIPRYYNDPDRLAASIVERDGRRWFRTGDLASRDEEGYFFIKGREKDMIIVGGENVYATEIEALLMTHDKVSDAAVKGMPATGPAAFLGEQIKAFVVTMDETLTENDIRRYCYERLPSYKVPQRVVFMKELPRNPSGKVVKGDLE